jgi:hypothetical protein
MHTEGESRNEAGAGPVAGSSRLAEQVLIGRDEEEEMTDEQSPVRRFDHGIHHQSPRRHTALTHQSPSYVDQPSLLSIRNCTNNFHTSRSRHGTETVPALNDVLPPRHQSTITAPTMRYQASATNTCRPDLISVEAESHQFITRVSASYNPYLTLRAVQ